MTTADLDASGIAVLIQNSLAILGAGYERDGDVLIWRGERPSQDWHVHGWTEATRKMVVAGTLRARLIRKRRWRRKDRSATRHSRPPDDLGLLYDAMIVAAELWCWLNAAVGLHRYRTPHDDGPDRRTVQRWLHRALPHALATQHAIRVAVIERFESEPRPFETLFPGGLSPPAALVRRRWLAPDEVTRLWRGLALLFGAARRLTIGTAPLLAEARGRMTDPTSTFLL